MKTAKILLLLSAVAFVGCAVESSYARPEHKFLLYRKIAVISFSNPKDAPAGQEAADIVALEFADKAFTVVGSSQLMALIEQSEFYTAGMTPEIKAKLKQSGIEAVVLGKISEYSCSNTDLPPTALNIGRKNVCNVSLTAQMVDINTGEIVWGATASDTQEGAGLTPKRVLLGLAKKMSLSIPEAPKKPSVKK